MSEEIRAADALLTANASLSRQIGELNTTIGYQDAMLRRAEADAGWLRGLVQRAIKHLDEYGEIGTPRAAMAEDLEVKLGKTGDAGAALLAELGAARAVGAYLNDRTHWTAGICPTCGFGRRLDGSEYHGSGCVLAAYNEATKATAE